MPPEQQRGEATVERLPTTALRVYADSGRQGFTVNAVTAADGVSLGSLYHPFGSFDGLAAALHARCAEELCGEVVAALARTRTARTGVRALVTTYLRFTEEHPEAALFLHASAYSGPLVADADIDRTRAARTPLLAAIEAISQGPPGSCRTASGVRSARSDGRARPVRVTLTASRTGDAQRPAEPASPVGTVNVTAAAATVTSASLPRA
ncbi:TetR/AcrR family transcriptional regulator [Streptomyces zaomyceticus]|uniref:TetR/AcrR family transcriptional regulator n=1 Tax=Streptomyces zaomyceticus TaxID=68286 RepID=UPI0032469ED0